MKFEALKNISVLLRFVDIREVGTDYPTTNFSSDLAITGELNIIGNDPNGEPVVIPMTLKNGHTDYMFSSPGEKSGIRFNSRVVTEKLEMEIATINMKLNLKGPDEEYIIPDHIAIIKLDGISDDGSREVYFVEKSLLSGSFKEEMDIDEYTYSYVQDTCPVKMIKYAHVSMDIVNTFKWLTKRGRGLKNIKGVHIPKIPFVFKDENGRPIVNSYSELKLNHNDTFDGDSNLCSAPILEGLEGNEKLTVTYEIDFDSYNLLKDIQAVQGKLYLENRVYLEVTDICIQGLKFWDRFNILPLPSFKFTIGYYDGSIEEFTINSDDDKICIWG